jgi:DedD protein
MERRAKERLIGAAILVTLAVIVVPELLSGPKPDAARSDAPAQLPTPAGAASPVRNVTVDLTTSKPLLAAAQAAAPSMPAATSTSVPTPPLSAPASDADAVGSAPVETAAPVATPPAPQAASPQAPVASPQSAGSFAVQLGSFANRSNAENLVHQLKAQGYAVYMLSEGSGKAIRYRVRVGPLNDRDAAERTMAKLNLAGHASTLVAPR